MTPQQLPLLPGLTVFVGKEACFPLRVLHLHKDGRRCSPGPQLAVGRIRTLEDVEQLHSFYPTPTTQVIQIEDLGACIHPEDVKDVIEELNAFDFPVWATVTNPLVLDHVDGNRIYVVLEGEAHLLSETFPDYSPFLGNSKIWLEYGEFGIVHGAKRTRTSRISRSGKEY